MDSSFRSHCTQCSAKPRQGRHCLLGCSAGPTEASLIDYLLRFQHTRLPIPQSTFFTFISIWHFSLHHHPHHHRYHRHQHHQHQSHHHHHYWWHKSCRTSSSENGCKVFKSASTPDCNSSKAGHVKHHYHHHSYHDDHRHSYHDQHCHDDGDGHHLSGSQPACSPPKNPQNSDKIWQNGAKLTRSRRSYSSCQASYPNS